ncbi:MAG: hypothetical protein UV76_C0001G0023 [Candidatus Nomurabacteria bacterium GW2011_GWA2_43_15]|uniref:Integral membrane protein (PIN domain superfamily) n=2 Tax=Candidatus Nomuraibacteriota TaxID=1752729 RepID=A0A0G1DUE6_9BACT|nr:MAG: hypothetical protein UV76_C0001G0023 [Candidatus Nomurabacteria bacterium GW2011_GWA2_43_15]KKT19220.1 MAG: hypothetical protein UW02_C0013G0003 [Candidatus Nomurabacteria bacterium GW2011_GWB1_43_7]
MDTTLLVAKVLGVYLVVSGLFLLIKGKTVPHLLKDFFEHPAVVYLTGAILIFLSSMYLIQYNVWDGTWHTLVTLFVWIVLLKGVTYILFPQALSELAVKRFKNSFSAYGVIAVIAGLYLFFLN